MEQSNKKEKSLITAINEMILSKILDINISFPAKIKSYDSSTQRATVIPLIKDQFYKIGVRGVQIREEDNAGYPELFSVEVAPIPDVPVRWPVADNSNCYIHMPLKKGDLGMCNISTRSLENYLSNEWKRSQECFPLEHNNIRHHDLSDAWFEPGVLPKNKTIQLPSNVDENSIVINNTSTTMEICNDGCVAIKNEDNEIIDILIQLFEAIRDIRVPTMMGIVNLLAIDRAALDLIITKLKTFEK